MYRHDQNDAVPLNIGAGAQADWESWVRGNMTLDYPPPNSFYLPADSTNRLYLEQSPLVPHGASSGLWRCPSDKSTHTFGSKKYPRVRSLSMNVDLGYYHPTGNLSFADGHAEPHKWIDPRTRPPLVRDHELPLDIFTVNSIPSPGNRDVQWLQERAYQRGD